MKTYGFAKGGFVYEDKSAPPRDRSVVAFLPALSVLPLIQHAGPPVHPVVSVGDRIGEGMVVGRANARGSANVHAAVPGRVVRTVQWPMPDGRTSPALVVRLEGSFDKLGRRQELFTWNGLSPSELQRIIAEKGVVELEEPGRPLAELLAENRTSGRRSTIVIRAIFDDPWLAADYAVCAERLDAIVEGAAVLVKTAGAAQALFAVSASEIAIGEAFVAAASRFGFEAQVVALESRYPQRNRRELEAALRRYEKREGRELGDLLPLSPSTLAAVYDAVRLNKPLLERYVAIGGGAVKHPTVLRVRIGTRIGDAIAECGGFVEEPKRIVSGSPLTGLAVFDLDSPITKTTFAVVALTSRQIGGTAVRECIGCGECRNVCPVGLDPERLFKLALQGDHGAAIADGAQACHGCGCCAALCPSRLPLSAMIRRSAELGDKK
jgi:Na+-translocating ferredoxin:NAD+ oxidoreductase subunit C